MSNKISQNQSKKGGEILHEADYEFTYDNGSGQKCRLSCPVPIPLPYSVEDFGNRLMLAHNIPEYSKCDLIHRLKDFVKRETHQYHSDQASLVIDRVQTGAVDVDKLIDSWCKVFHDEHKAYSNTIQLQDSDVFSQYYHTLIHSPALETLLDVEHNYASVVRNICEERDHDLEIMKRKHEEEMDQVVAGVGKAYTDEDVNLLATKHFENKLMLESQFASELSSLKNKQKKDYRDLIMRMYEENETRASVPATPALPSVASHVPTSDTYNDYSSSHDPSTTETAHTMEESFTVNLGAQQKTMHNLRLMCIDPLQLCTMPYQQANGTDPRRLQTAMSLYSNKLCGLVLLVDNRINSFTGIKHEFAKICETSTDFHFDDLEKQLDMIREDAVIANERRCDLQQQQTSCGGDSVSAGLGAAADPRSGGSNLTTGDLYMTRHSNLSECHVVFHLVVDERVSAGDITSRHRVVLALRNILKIACQYDIATLSLPLLLNYQLTEEMTVPWCIKRAELVYKCVKGFMIEMASWGGNQSHTVQFLVPVGISESLFTTFSTMLPQIFTISNPKLLKEAKQMHSTSQQSHNTAPSVATVYATKTSASSGN